MQNDEIRARILAMPRIDLHRHLEGSLRLTTLVDIARQYHIEMPEFEVETLRPFVQMMPDETRNSQHFLSKFMTLRQFYRSPEIIERIAYEAVEDAALDNVRYLELRFTPRALCKVSELPLDEMVPLVCRAGNQAAADHDIDVRFIVSMNRHEPVEIGETTLRAAISNQHLGVVGLDLAGDEENYSSLPFRALFKRASAAGLGVTIHAGEWAGVDSVWDAVGNLNADRVGHGIALLEDIALTQVVAERQVTLEVCPTSNVLTGAVLSLEDHPLAHLFAHDVPVTVNTDDPLICDLTLSDEYFYLHQAGQLTFNMMKKTIMNAARAAFLSDDERKALIQRFETQLATT